MNQRTATKATIKRASAAARAAHYRIDAGVLEQLKAIYRQGSEDLQASILSHADGDGTLRLEVMQQLLGQVEAKLQNLSSMQRRLLDVSLLDSAENGLAPFKEALPVSALTQVPHEAVKFVHNFIAADGLQLSDRLWRIDSAAVDDIGKAIKSAVIQGHSASRAAQEFLSKGQAVPADVQRKLGAADADKLARQAGATLMTGEGNPYDNALRLFRTEINRAHGEAYILGGEGHEDFGGWRFKLSPNHPEPDICNMHASANLHGLGAGVYPSREQCPWPAHPNTISFVEIVFKDEITPADRAGQVSHLDWLNGQTQRVQAGVLGSKAKAVALQKGVLQKSEIATPWRVLKQRYERRGVDLSAFKVTRLQPPDSTRTLVVGMPHSEFMSYASEAFQHAPTAMQQVLNSVGLPASVRVLPSGGSYFLGNSITLDSHSMVKRAFSHSEHDVWRHEYGHYLDFWAMAKSGKPQPISSMAASKGGLKGAFDAASTSLHARSAAQKARRERLRSEIIAFKDIDLADLFGALTRNKVGFGHSVEYLSRPGFAESEVFANLTDIYSRKDRGAWRYVQQELPDLAATYEDIIRRLASDT